VRLQLSALFIILLISCLISCARRQPPQRPGIALPQKRTIATQATLPENPLATIQVDPLHLGAKIPNSFLGLSLDYPEVEKAMGTIRKPISSFVNLLNHLRRFNGPPILRVGGDAQDESWFSNTRTQRPDNVRFTINTDLIQSLDAAAQATQSKLILGLNLGADDPSILLNWVEAAQNDFLPEQIFAFELGNEPDNYQKHIVNNRPLRGKHWDYETYSKQFDHYKEMLTNHFKGRKSLAAPAFAKAFIPDAPNFIERESMDLQMATLHYYPLNGCDETDSHARSSTSSSIQTLLQPSSSKEFFKTFDPVFAISRRLTGPLRIDDVAPVSCDGLPDVRQSFGAALWSLGFMFDFARAGGAGVNFRVSSTIGPEPKAAPIFYAMMLFAEATQNSSSFIPLQLEGSAAIRAWSVLDKNGMIRTVLVNTSGATGTVTLKIPHASSAATVVRLTAPSLTSQNGVKFGGQTFDQSKDGDLLGTRTEESLNSVHELFPVSLPAASSAIISVQFNPR
jgi:hypothetical protein